MCVCVCVCIYIYIYIHVCVYYIYNVLVMNCLIASADEAKQPNWNKTHEVNISLVSTTIFLGGKKEHWFCIIRQ